MSANSTTGMEMCCCNNGTTSKLHQLPAISKFLRKGRLRNPERFPKGSAYNPVMIPKTNKVMNAGAVHVKVMLRNAKIDQWMRNQIH